MGQVWEVPTTTGLAQSHLSDCTSLLEQLACVIKAPELETPPNHSLSLFPSL